ncbi:hypothetical protein BH09ACT10_BH09ACT10_16510 [soil metagenome]
MVSTSPQRIVIVGAGHGGVAAATLLRREGHDGPIVVLSEESYVPYHRPPISKSFGGGALEQPLLTSEAAEAHEIDLRCGVEVSAIDRQNNSVVLSDGSREPYDALVLATGASPRRLPCDGGDVPGVTQIRTLDDGFVLRSEIRDGTRVVVIGGGWLGLEVAAAASALGAVVTVVEREDRLLARVGSPELSSRLEIWHRSRGVDVRTSTGTSQIRTGPDGRAASVLLDGGETLDCDLVVVAIGANPATEIARTAKLRCDTGIIVDSSGRTNDPKIFALGDVAQPEEGRRLESIPHAANQAAAVVATLLGKDQPLAESPWFWSNQGSLRIQIAGLLDLATQSRLVVDSDDTFVVVHTDDGGLLCAVEAVGSSHAFTSACQMISSGKSVNLQSLPGDLLPGSLQVHLESATDSPASSGGESEPTSKPSGSVLVRFVEDDGTENAAECELNTTLMEAGVALGLPWIVGECGGNSSCGTCRVRIASPWNELLDEAFPEEIDLLEFSGLDGPDVRLGCQIMLRQDLNGIVVGAPPG